MITCSSFFRGCPQPGVYEQDQESQVVLIFPLNFGIKDAYHILLHILGRYHEHQRPDRDQYVGILWENVQNGNKQSGDDNTNIARCYSSLQYRKPQY